MPCVDHPRCQSANRHTLEACVVENFLPMGISHQKKQDQLNHKYADYDCNHIEPLEKRRPKEIELFFNPERPVMPHRAKTQFKREQIGGEGGKAKQSYRRERRMTERQRNEHRSE